MKQTFRLLIVVLMITVSACIGDAATLYVATNGSDSNAGTQTQPFKTIQRGLTVAQNGDTVLVGNGTYSGSGNTSLDFQGKSLTLRSLGGAARCIQNCQGQLAFKFVDTGSAIMTLDGFTIENGLDPDTPIPALGKGAIIILNGNNLTAQGPTIQNCVFLNNGSVFDPNGNQIYGGAIHIQGNPVIRNCTFTGNMATQGTIDVHSGSPTITNCTFQNNPAGGINCVRQGLLTVTSCVFQNSSRGLNVTGGAAQIENCQFLDNVGDAGTGVFLQSVTGNVINCLFRNNQATLNGGAAFVNSDGPLLSFLHCTFAGNTAMKGGADVSMPFGAEYITFTNSILWSSGPLGFADGQKTTNLTYCDVAGGYTGTGNINQAPNFVSSTDLHLQASSPCINAGIASAPNEPVFDLDGAPRILGSAPDMGAYEFVQAGSLFVNKNYTGSTELGTLSQPFKTMAAALNAATVAGPNFIYIYAGNYNERPRITKPVKLLNWGMAGIPAVGRP